MKTRIKNNNLLNFNCTLNVDILVITRYISQTQLAISQYQTCNKELLTRLYMTVFHTIINVSSVFSKEMFYINVPL